MSKLSALKNFPVEWKPGEQERFWAQGKMHSPFAMTPISAYFCESVIGAGFLKAFQYYKIPMTFEYRVLNSYLYASITPHDLSHEELHAAMEIANRNCDLGVEEIENRWGKVWYPEISKLNERIESVNYQHLNNAELASYFEDVIQWATRLWEIHFQLAIPMVMAPSVFQETYDQLFSPKNKFESVELLEGFDNESIITGLKIWELSQQVSNNPVVLEIFRTVEKVNIIEKCRHTKGAEDFVKRVDQFLLNHGKRNENPLEVNSSTWIQDSRPLISMIEVYLKNPENNFQVIHKKKRAARVIREKQIREAMSQYPQSIRESFEKLLLSAQFAIGLQETHNYLIDARVVYLMRHLLTEVAARAVKDKALKHAEDIYYLYPNEILTLLRKNEVNQQEIEKRKEKVKQASTVEAPAVLGTVPSSPPPHTPFLQAVEKFFGGAPKTSTEENILLGNPASPGKVSGRVVVIRHVTEAHQLKRGDILVTRTTSPAWTPYFAIVGGVITDAGGMLSHCAIVAREYNIPAIVGMDHATSLLKTGMWIEVDGDHGSVQIQAINPALNCV